MATDTAGQPGRVLGIGGVFFKSADSDRLNTWDGENLGFERRVEGFVFHWRAHDQPETHQSTAWSVFPAASTYFDPSPASFMINYIVDDLDTLLAKLAAKGVRIDPKREESESAQGLLHDWPARK